MNTDDVISSCYSLIFLDYISLDVNNLLQVYIDGNVWRSSNGLVTCSLGFYFL